MDPGCPGFSPGSPAEIEWKRLEDMAQALVEEVIRREEDADAWETERKRLEQGYQAWKHREGLALEWEQEKRQLSQELEQYAALEALERECAALGESFAQITEKAEENQRQIREKKERIRMLNQQLDRLRSVEVERERLSEEEKAVKKALQKGESLLAEQERIGQQECLLRETEGTYQREQAHWEAVRSEADQAQRHFCGIRPVCRLRGWWTGNLARCVVPGNIPLRQRVQREICPKRRQRPFRSGRSGSIGTVLPWPINCLNCGGR